MSASSGAPRRAVLWLTAAALCVDMTVYGLVVPFLPGYAAGLGLSESAIGALFAVYALALLGGAWALSWLARRVAGRTLLVGGALTLSASIVAFALASEPWLLFVARALQGAASAVPWTVGPALVAELYPPQERGRAMGIVQSGSGTGMLLGPPVGGALYALGGYQLPFFATAAAAALLTAVTLWVLRANPLAVQPGATARDERAPGPLGVVRQRTVALASAAIVVGGGVMAGLEPILPLDLAARFATRPLDNGLLFGATVLCFAATAPLAGRLCDRVGRLRVSAAGLLGLCATLPAIALAPSVGTCAVAMAAHGIALSLTLSPTMPAMADGIDTLRAGGARVDYTTVYVVFNAAFGVGMFLGPALGALAAEAFGGTCALVAMAAVCGASGAALAWATRRRRPRRRR